MAKRSLITILFFLPCLGLMAQFYYTEKISSTQSSILQLDFQSARQLIQEGNKDESGIINWIDAYQEFVDFLTTNEAKDISETTAFFEDNLSKSEKLNSKNEFYYVSQADIELMLSYLKFSNQDYLQAFIHYSNARGKMDDLEKKFPESAYNQRYKLIKLTVDVVFQEIIPIPGFKIPNEERKTLFTKQLNEILNNQRLPVPFKIETEIASVIYYGFIDPSDNGCFELIESFGNEWYKKGPLQSFLYIKQASRSSHYNESYIALQFANLHKYSDKLNLLNLQSGNIYLNRMNDSCQMYLSQFISRQINKKDVAYAQLKLSWWYFLTNQSLKTDSICNLIISSSYPETSDNKQAIYEISLRENWDPILLKARLLFDAGNFTACRDLLLASQKQVNQLNKFQQTEFAYRMARACDKTHQWDFAIKFYHMAMNSGLENQLYYPCYSAFYLGSIYLQQNNQSMADRYFNICRQMKSPIYQESIHHKASEMLSADK